MKGAASVLNCLQMHPMNLACNGFYPSNGFSLAIGHIIRTLSSNYTVSAGDSNCVECVSEPSSLCIYAHFYVHMLYHNDT